MFGILKKSKPQQDVYFPFKTVFEKEQLIFDKKQFASNGFDFVQKQRKRQNRCDDEKWVRSGDRPFTKAKRSNRDVPDQDELQTYASLEKMLHKAIHVVRQLKKKGNTNTFSALKHQCKSSYLSSSDLKTNDISFDKSKAVKPTSKAHSTRCFKCHRIGHYANKCQKQKPLVTLENENLETKPEKEDHLPIQKLDQTQGEHYVDYGSFAYNPFPFNVSDLRTNLFKEEGNDVPQSTDHYMEPAQHGVQDVLNISTEVHVFHRTRLDLDHARLEKDHARLEKDHARLDVDHARLDEDHARLDLDHARLNEDHARLDLDHARLDLGGEETEDGHAFSSGGPSGQSRKRPYLYPVHSSGSDEPGHLG
ncbi:hypothetical protein YC2023_077334 [Brassica napus]